MRLHEFLVLVISADDKVPPGIPAQSTTRDTKTNNTTTQLHVRRPLTQRIVEKSTAESKLSAGG